MARVTISLPDLLAEAAVKQAEAQRRSASAYIALLIETDLRSKGVICGEEAPALAEFIAKVQAAAAASPRIVDRLEATLRRELRPKKSAA